MFQQLNNNYHKVITGLTVLYKDYLYSDSITTNIKFKFISDVELENYWNSNEPQDKAGGYGIQGLGGRFVERIDGSFTNVVGLPIERLKEVIDEVVAYEKITC
jgi:septum formation protein